MSKNQQFSFLFSVKARDKSAPYCMASQDRQDLARILRVFMEELREYVRNLQNTYVDTFSTQKVSEQTFFIFLCAYYGVLRTASTQIDHKTVEMLSPELRTYRSFSIQKQHAFRECKISLPFCVFQLHRMPVHFLIRHTPETPQTALFNEGITINIILFLNDRSLAVISLALYMGIDIYFYEKTSSCQNSHVTETSVLMELMFRKISLPY